MIIHKPQLRWYRNTPSVSTPCAATKARDKPANTGTTLLLSLRSRSPRMLIFDANANPHNTPESLRWSYAASTKQRGKRGEGGAKTRPVARLSATRRSSRPGRRTTPQQPCREKRRDHHSPMKHSKRRMFGTYGQGRRHAPHLLKAGLPAHYLVEVNSRKNARGEQKCEKCQRLYSAET